MVILNAFYFEGGQRIENYLLFIAVATKLLGKDIPEISQTSTRDIPYGNNNQTRGSESNSDLLQQTRGQKPERFNVLAYILFHVIQLLL